MKYPLGVVALFYAGGLLLAELCPLPLSVLFGVALGMIVCALIIPKLRLYVLWPLVVLTGWTMLAARTAIVSPHDLRDIFGTEPKQVIVRAVLCETPRERTRAYNSGVYTNSMARADVMAVCRGVIWTPAYGRIMVFSRGPASANIHAGQEVEITGILSPPPRPIAEGLFDYRTHLKRQGIYRELRAKGPGAWSPVPSQPAKPPLSDRFLAWARATLSRDLPSDEAQHLLLAMTLGWKADITSETYETFMQSGTMHIFAISGLHIAMIAGILVTVLRVVRVPRFWSGIVVIPLIWFYTAATGWQPSAIRSSIMMTVIVGGWALNRPGNLLNSLGTAAFIILLWDPQQLFQASFQLSFLVVLSIALFQPPLERLLDRRLAADPLRPAEPPSRWKQWLRTPARHITTALVTSLAAWLGSLMLTAYYFHLFSPVTVPANLFIVPLSSVALACELGSLLCGDWLPGVGMLFNNCAWFCMNAMIRFSHWTIVLPGACLHVRSPTLPDFAIFYALLFGVLSGRLFLARWRPWTALGLAGIAIFYLYRWHLNLSTVQITVLPLKGGSAIFCDAPGRANDLLVDCGNSDSVISITEPFLRAQGVNRLPHLLLTHGDIRSVGGANLLWTDVPVEQVVTSPIGFRSPVYHSILDALQTRPNLQHTVSRGDSTAGWQLLHPDMEDRFPRADDKTIVLLGNWFGIRVLLLSELGQAGQRKLFDRQTDLRADIVIAGLPEHAEPLNESLLWATRPKLIIITDSEYPATRRAGEELRNRLEMSKIPVLYTRTTDAVTIKVTKSGWQVRGMTGEPITSASLK